MIIFIGLWLLSLSRSVLKYSQKSPLNSIDVIDTGPTWYKVSYASVERADKRAVVKVEHYFTVHFCMTFVCGLTQTYFNEISFLILHKLFFSNLHTNCEWDISFTWKRIFDNNHLLKDSIGTYFIVLIDTILEVLVTARTF